MNFRANVTFGTPSLYVDMIAIIKRDNLKLNSLLVAGYGGAPCPEQLALDIKNILGAKRLQVIQHVNDYKSISTINLFIL